MGVIKRSQVYIGPIAVLGRKLQRIARALHGAKIQRRGLAQALIAIFARKNGRPARVVVGRDRAQLHRQPNRHLVADGPLTRDGRITTRRRPHVAADLLTVNADLGAAGNPAGDPHRQGPAATAGTRHGQGRGVAEGELGLLRHDHAVLIIPLHGRGDEQVHVQGAVVAAPEVDAVHQLGVGLDSRPLAAPEAFVIRAPRAASPGRADSPSAARVQRCKVGDVAVPIVRVLLAQQVVEQCTLVKVKLGRVVHARRGVVHKQLPRQLKHVVRVAGLGRVLDQVSGDGVGRAKVLRLAVAADGVRVGLDGNVPGVARNVQVPLLLGGLVLARGADPLGNLGVGVQAVERVLVLSERVQHGGVVEPPRRRQPALLAGLVEDVGEDLAHAAKLGAHHALHLRVRQVPRPRVDPARHVEQDVLGLGAAHVPPHVEQPGHGLVDGVVWHVAVGEGALLHGCDVGLWEAREVTGLETSCGVVVLALGQLLDELLGPAAAFVILEDGPAVGPGREEMTLDMAAEGEGGCIPAAIGLGAIGGQVVVCAEVVKQTVEVDKLDISQGAVLVVSETALVERHLGQVKGQGGVASVVEDGLHRRLGNDIGGCACQPDDVTEVMIPASRACNVAGRNKANPDRRQDQVRPRHERIRNFLPQVGPQRPEPLNHPHSVLESHLLTHLDLALQPIQHDLHPDDVLLHHVNVPLGRIPYPPLLPILVAHQVALTVARQRLDLRLQEVAGPRVGVVVKHAHPAVAPDGAVVPSRHHFARRRLGGRVEARRDVVAGRSVEEHRGLGFDHAARCTGRCRERLGLRVGSRHMTAQHTELRLRRLLQNPWDVRELDARVGEGRD
ncbi:hypothetical protein PgNI_10951 [Pyricularia grisea]|uniref:Uncharacterized protein n=1 Tax=Pyricularia grisea TaxID=148305 RepID=A0A6P8AZU6_PYRGI|nr:hypothetical protein PgNI_10951 [Pyricularia grisea]TLD07751.1 hypothetical protein PgNI_10951 [Pyricularia grisea]